MAATAHQFDFPLSVLAEADGGFLVTDNEDNCIKRVTRGGHLEAYAGTCGSAGAYVSGHRTEQARFDEPADLARAPDGGVYVSDLGNHCVRHIGLDDIVRTVAGQCGDAGPSTPAESPVDWGDGLAATSAFLKFPGGLDVGPDGALYIADGSNPNGASHNRIRRVDPDGRIATVAGSAHIEEGARRGALERVALTHGGEALFFEVWPRYKDVAGPATLYLVRK